MRMCSVRASPAKFTRSPPASAPAPKRLRKSSTAGPAMVPAMVPAAPMKLCLTSWGVVPAAPASLGEAPILSIVPLQPGAKAGPAGLYSRAPSQRSQHCPFSSGKT